MVYVPEWGNGEYLFSCAPSYRWRCWSASLQRPCQMWCWVSMWGTQRVRETPNWVTLMIPQFLKDQLRPPSPPLYSMCTTNAGMVTHRALYKTSPTDLTFPMLFHNALAFKFLLLRCSFHPPLWKSSEWEESWGAAAVHRCPRGHFWKSVSQERASGACAAQRGRLRQDDEQETRRILQPWGNWAGPHLQEPIQGRFKLIYVCTYFIAIRSQTALQKKKKDRTENPKYFFQTPGQRKTTKLSISYLQFLSYIFQINKVTM